ncbi:MAG: hypothetical protein EBY83_02320 [Verrucomicrobia bacterium]|nr:hypothetical protein [Verrucomicrobiota bacterium]
MRQKKGVRVIKKDLHALILPPPYLLFPIQNRPPRAPYEFPRDSGNSNRRGTSIENGRGQVRGGQVPHKQDVVGPLFHTNLFRNRKLSIQHQASARPTPTPAGSSPGRAHHPR